MPRTISITSLSLILAGCCPDGFVCPDLPSPREPIPTTGHEDETHQLRLVLTNPDPSAMRASLRSGPPGVIMVGDMDSDRDFARALGARYFDAEEFFAVKK